MKLVAPTLAFALLGSLHLAAAELRETQFPTKLPKSITVAGADYRSSERLKPWAAADPAIYAGRYESHTITDGFATLDVKLHRAKSADGSLRWHVGGTLDTAFAGGPHHVLTFKNSELKEPKLPCFDVIDRVTPGLFVWFTDPDRKGPPKPAVIIGDHVYVKK